MSGRALRLSIAMVAVCSAGSVGAALTITPRESWVHATDALDSGNINGADAKLSEMLETGKSLGIRRFPLYAESAASLSRQAHKQGNTEVSQWAMRAAEQLDPDSPNVAFTAADLARDQSNLPAMARHLLRGFVRLLADISSRTISSSDLMIVAILVLALSASVFALVLFFRYSRSTAHDFRELLSSRFSAGVTTVLAFAMLLLPLFLWLGPMWLVVYWFAIFFGYASIRERIMIVVSLIVLALSAPMLDWVSYRLAAADNAIVNGAIVSQERSYSPEALRRLEELGEIIPDEPEIHLLLGNLQMLTGDDNEALVRYRKAVELKENYAGAHLNIGNYHFLNNDFKSAIASYQRAAELDPNLAITFYNSSVASGELYNFDEQGQKLEEAKNLDRAQIESIIGNPPAQKVVLYDLPLQDAWVLNRKIAASGKGREIFGSYAHFDPIASLMNPLTIGAVLGLLAALVIFMKKRSAGFAGSCIKCGRTFCFRCKSARESATYCTQCIHIYLKRDGVSVDTKRSKMSDVQGFQTRSVRLKKILTVPLPGSAQLLDGSTLRGLLGLVVFFFFVLLAIFIGRLAPAATPAETMRIAVRTIAIILAIVTWGMISIPVFGQKSSS